MIAQRESLGLEELGVDVGLLDTRPEMSTVVSKIAIENYKRKLQENIPNVDFSTTARKRRRERMGRAENSIKLAEANIKKFKRILHNCQALKPYDDTMRDLQLELDSQKSMNSRGTLGFFPPSVPQRRVKQDYLPELHDPRQDSPLHDQFQDDQFQDDQSQDTDSQESLASTIERTAVISVQMLYDMLYDMLG